MKRPPRAGELALIHSSAQSGDVQAFAVCADNYDPAILARMPTMTREPMGGYLLDPNDDGFVVIRASDGARITHNAISRDQHAIRLHTTILAPMDADEAYMLADLEQCAALALLGIEVE